ncbi:unnamed protein product [Phytophthora fragariaefolia]|uniref:Unnamed protein product n=1 Tax=Phytophthora fragariaefolia TaxID=1490495 RepID=A0A9W6UB93_9STRA|nr:unnamed protein product [Phytophthora fragariaefolia]
MPSPRLSPGRPPSRSQGTDDSKCRHTATASTPREPSWLETTSASIRKLTALQWCFQRSSPNFLAQIPQRNTLSSCFHDVTGTPGTTLGPERADCAQLDNAGNESGRLLAIVRDEIPRRPTPQLNSARQIEK